MGKVFLDLLVQNECFQEVPVRVWSLVSEIPDVVVGAVFVCSRCEGLCVSSTLPSCVRNLLVNLECVKDLFIIKHR